MIREATVEFIGSGAGNILGYAAKQMFVLHAVDSVGKELQTHVSAVAKKFFGSWAGSALGFQAGIVLAVPVTSLVGDLLWACISNGVRSACIVSARLCGVIEGSSASITLKQVIIRVTAVSFAYLVKVFIVNSGVSTVQSALQLIFRQALPLLAQNSAMPSFLLSPVLSLSASVLAAPVTILIADLAGIILQESLIRSLSFCAREPQCACPNE